MTRKATATAWIGVGANLGDSVRTVRTAISALSEHPDFELMAASSLYRTAPIGCDDQPDYVNAVVALTTAIEPVAVLERLLALEQGFGRVRSYQNAPRVLDLDLLLYNDEAIEQSGLQVPHPRMHTRAFVLAPLAELKPDLIIPGKGPVQTLLANVANQAIERISEE